MKFKEGDYVKIIERDATAADMKSGTFYPYFCGLAGTVDRIYDKEICIKVDLETLPEDILKRHTSVQESIRRKWLNGLSGEARNRLTPEEKKFELAYTMLVQETDLEKAKQGTVTRPKAVKSVRALTADEIVPHKMPAMADEEIEDEEVEEVEVAEAAPEPAPKARAKKAEAAPKAEKPAPKPAKAPKAEAKPAAKPEKTAKAEDKPVTPKDLDAAELAFLKEREKALKEK